MPLYARLLGLVLVGGVLAGCATRNAFQRGEEAGFAGDWDAAVEYHQRAVQEDPGNPIYRIGLERAMLTASRVHLSLARELEANGDLAGAVREYRLAAEFNPANTQVAGKARDLERTLRDRAEASRPRAPIEEMRERARQKIQLPLLDPASAEPLRLQFADAGLQDILDFIGNATGSTLRTTSSFRIARTPYGLTG